MKLRAFASLLSETVREDSQTRSRRKSLASFKNAQSGQVLILGNGPSVNNLGISQLLRFQNSGGKIAVMNGFLLSGLASELLPDYYFLVDPTYWNSEDREGVELREKLDEHLRDVNQKCVVVQPANQPLLSTSHGHYLFVDGRASSGLTRTALPNRPWGLPSSLAMTAISTTRFLGFETIYFAGLDSDSYKAFFVDDLNEVMFSSDFNYFFKQASTQENPDSDFLGRRIRDWPIRNMSDVLYAAAVFMSDLHELAGKECVNVGNDRTNNSASRACLLK